jgi:tRNA threonylcarbamoyladenosine biosynthesis protein TsaB
MLVLALDTTTRAGSCALARDGLIVREQCGDESRSQAARLPEELMSLLDREHQVLRDIDIFAVAIGPGSFTGLRVGIATMQGLAFAAGKALIGVSGLDALARIAARAADTERTSRVATWVDAWRGEVYAALYQAGVQIDGPTVEHPHELLGRIASQTSSMGPGVASSRQDRASTSQALSRTMFIGDGVRAYAEAIRVVLPAAEIAEPLVPMLAGTIAAMAAEQASRGHLPPPHAIRPLYVRRPDAELSRDARHGS